jgi:hypothetical protein
MSPSTIRKPNLFAFWLFLPFLTRRRDFEVPFSFLLFFFESFFQIIWLQDYLLLREKKHAQKAHFFLVL